MASKFLNKLATVLAGNKGIDNTSSGNSLGRRAIVTGSVALGALITGAVLEKARRTKFPFPYQLTPALDAPVFELLTMEGYARYYRREGSGVPIVLLHSINAAGSSYEMKPIFDHLAKTTDRPIYAMDWLGFGLSDRPPVRYRPGLYQRHLRRFLTEHVGESADVIALSLASEYAATIANAYPALVRRLVFISPTALGPTNRSVVQRTAIEVASGVGAFEVLFARLSTRENIRRFYQKLVFSQDAEVPQDLVDYAYLTSHAKGAHFAPRWFVEGALFMHDYAWRTYTNLSVPVLIVLPRATPDSVQAFDRASELKGINPSIFELVTLPTGLLPQWEGPDLLFETLDVFLTTETTPATTGH